MLRMLPGFGRKKNDEISILKYGSARLNANLEKKTREKEKNPRNCISSKDEVFFIKLLFLNHVFPLRWFRLTATRAKLKMDKRTAHNLF